MTTFVRLILVFAFAWVFYEGVSGLVGDSGGINYRRIGMVFGAIALGTGFVALRQRGHDKRRELHHTQDDQNS